MKKIDSLLKNIRQVILLISLAACSKTTQIVPEFEFAKYAAVVQCYDEFGLRVDNSDVKVYVDGLEHLSEKTDDSGYFELKVPVGTYTFNYAKEGFGDHCHQMVTLIGGYQPVLYYGANLFKPVDVAVSEYKLIYNPQENTILAEGFASSETPFDLYLGYKTDLNSNIKKFFSVAYCNSGYKDGVAFSDGIGFLEQNLDGDVNIYMALYSRNYFEYLQYSTLIQLTEFQKLVLVK